MLLPWNNIYGKLAMNELAKIGSWVSYVGVGMAKGSMMDWKVGADMYDQ